MGKILLYHHSGGGVIPCTWKGENNELPEECGRLESHQHEGPTNWTGKGIKNDDSNQLDLYHRSQEFKQWVEEDKTDLDTDWYERMIDSMDGKPRYKKPFKNEGRTITLLCKWRGMIVEPSSVYRGSIILVDAGTYSIPKLGISNTYFIINYEGKEVSLISAASEIQKKESQPSESYPESSLESPDISEFPQP